MPSHILFPLSHCEDRGKPPVKSCPLGTSFVRKRTLHALYGALWQLHCTDALLRALPLPNPQQLPRRSGPLAQKIQISNFLDREGTTPGAAASKCPGRRSLLALSSR
jgi:hypothetical protein